MAHSPTNPFLISGRSYETAQLLAADCSGARGRHDGADGMIKAGKCRIPPMVRPSKRFSVIGSGGARCSTHGCSDKFFSAIASDIGSQESQ